MLMQYVRQYCNKHLELRTLEYFISLKIWKHECTTNTEIYDM